jgi:hypothetical protein
MDSIPLQELLKLCVSDSNTAHIQTFIRWFEQQIPTKLNSNQPTSQNILDQLDYFIITPSPAPVPDPVPDSEESMYGYIIDDEVQWDRVLELWKDTLKHLPDEVMLQFFRQLVDVFDHDDFVHSSDKNREIMNINAYKLLATVKYHLKDMTSVLSGGTHSRELD